MSTTCEVCVTLKTAASPVYTVFPLWYPSVTFRSNQLESFMFSLFLFTFTASVCLLAK